MTEQSASPRPARLPQVLGYLGVYATYIAAALLLLVIAGDVYVLVLRPHLVGLLALVVVAGPLGAMLLSTFASYVNYYGVWRVLGGKDEYDVGQDLKSHAADIPQAVQAMLAGRRGCLPAGSAALVLVSLVLAGAANVPPSTPGLGVLGTWQGQDNGGGGALIAATATPTATLVPTATAEPTATATALPTATVRPTATTTVRPPVVPTATPTTGPVINFTVTPSTTTWTTCPTSPPAVTLTLDNSKSTVAVGWQATAVQLLPSGAPWATITPVTSGTVAAGSMQQITVTPSTILCRYSSPNGTAWTVNVATTNAGTPTFTYTVY